MTELIKLLSEVSVDFQRQQTIINELKLKNSKLEKDLKVSLNQIKTQNETIESLREQIDKLKEELESRKLESEKLERKVEKRDRKIAKLKKNIQKLEDLQAESESEDIFEEEVEFDFNSYMSKEDLLAAVPSRFYKSWSKSKMIESILNDCDSWTLPELRGLALYDVTVSSVFSKVLGRSVWRTNKPELIKAVKSVVSEIKYVKINN